MRSKYSCDCLGYSLGALSRTVKRSVLKKMRCRWLLLHLVAIIPNCSEALMRICLQGGRGERHPNKI